MNAASLYVVNLIDEFLQQDIYHCHSSELKKKSCMKWSAIELRNRLCNNNDIPPLMVMEGFREQMSSIASRHPETDIFQIVSVTAEYFIDIII